MTLVHLRVTSDGYEIQTGGAPLRVTVSHGGPVLQLTFPGAWRAARKGVLVRNLIAKQFQPMVPRLRIHLRRSR